ncbi:MAG: hypothetical protein H3C43_01245 [Leptonema sp. (in: Bacteria)]|nr:hypothetical protein [Leptonema sp. (in: bacteria)]
MKRYFIASGCLFMLLSCRTVIIEMKDYTPDPNQTVYEIGVVKVDSGLDPNIHIGIHYRPQCKQRNGMSSVKIQAHSIVKVYYTHFKTVYNSKPIAIAITTILFPGMILADTYTLFGYLSPMPNATMSYYTCASTKPQVVKTEETKEPETSKFIENFIPIATVHQSSGQTVTMVHSAQAIRIGEVLYVDDSLGRKIAVTITRVFHTRSDAQLSQPARIGQGAKVYRKIMVPANK